MNALSVKLMLLRLSLSIWIILLRRRVLFLSWHGFDADFYCIDTVQNDLKFCKIICALIVMLVTYVRDQGI